MEYNNINSIKNNTIIKINNQKQDDFSNGKKILLSDTTEINKIHEYLNNSGSLLDNVTNTNTDLNPKKCLDVQNINLNVSKSDKNELIINKDQNYSEKKKLNDKNDILITKLSSNESANNEIFSLYNDLVKEFTDFNDLTTKGLLKLKLSIKKFEKVINKSSLNKKKNVKNNDWGFTEQRVIPKSIELFFNIKQNSRLSRTDVGGLFQEYIQKNNLKGNINVKNKLDKRIYKVDDKLSTLFGLSNDQKNKINSCNSSNIKYPYGFNFYNYQTWIKKLYVEEFNIDEFNVDNKNNLIINDKK
jgi:acetone carboxylase gamma subunit